MLWLKMDGFFPLTNNMKNIYYRDVKGSSYRQEKKPTRIPSIRSKDPVPGQISCQQDLYPGNHAGVRVFFISPGENSYLRQPIRIVGGKYDEQHQSHHHSPPPHCLTVPQAIEYATRLRNFIEECSDTVDWFFPELFLTE
jgi:hypothetical protein